MEWGHNDRQASGHSLVQQELAARSEEVTALHIEGLQVAQSYPCQQGFLSKFHIARKEYL